MRLRVSTRRHLARSGTCAVSVLLAVASTVGLATATGTRAAGDGFGPPPMGEHTVQPLKHPCMTGEPEDLCRNIGVTDGWFNGHDVKFLYTQNYFCDLSVTSGADSGCEVGQKFNTVPPGTTSEEFTDPLFIPVPLFSPAPANLQCPAGPCVDHPMTIDLSRIAAALGASPDALRNVPVPGHDHIIADRNMDRPEWWPVYVIGVTNPDSFAKIRQGKDLATATRLAQDPNAGVTAPIPTNLFLWFQTLAGTSDNCPPDDMDGNGADRGTPTKS
ncbi:hypothetical protein AB0O91_01030 [Kitasatospora sp. NPDC089797]|uniref:hypothetical protein n=1 Tax=Kitasatospora sp. NPDC089797 TaxID=3155298 RepID=UPI00343A551A